MLVQTGHYGDKTGLEASNTAKHRKTPQRKLIMASRPGMLLAAIEDIPLRPTSLRHLRTSGGSLNGASLVYLVKACMGTWLAKPFSCNMTGSARIEAFHQFRSTNSAPPEALRAPLHESAALSAEEFLSRTNLARRDTLKMILLLAFDTSVQDLPIQHFPETATLMMPLTGLA